MTLTFSEWAEKIPAVDGTAVRNKVCVGKYSIPTTHTRAAGFVLGGPTAVHLLMAPEHAQICLDQVINMHPVNAHRRRDPEQTENTCKQAQHTDEKRYN